MKTGCGAAARGPIEGTCQQVLVTVGPATPEAPAPALRLNAYLEGYCRWRKLGARSDSSASRDSRASSLQGRLSDNESCGSAVAARPTAVSRPESIAVRRGLPGLATISLCTLNARRLPNVRPQAGPTPGRGADTLAEGLRASLRWAEAREASSIALNLPDMFRGQLPGMITP